MRSRSPSSGHAPGHGFASRGGAARVRAHSAGRPWAGGRLPHACSLQPRSTRDGADRQRRLQSVGPNASSLSKAVAPFPSRRPLLCRRTDSAVRGVSSTEAIVREVAVSARGRSLVACGDCASPAGGAAACWGRSFRWPGGRRRRAPGPRGHRPPGRRPRRPSPTPGRSRGG